MNHPYPGPQRPVWKQPLVVIVLAVVVLLFAGWLWSVVAAPSEELPPELVITSAQLSAAPDYALIGRTYSALRAKFAERPADIPRWRRLPDAARHALVLSWADGEFAGFAGIVDGRRSGPFHFQIDDLVAAYREIRATEVADAAEVAALRAGEKGADPDRGFADLDAQFLERRRRTDVAGQVRIFIRAHLDEIVNARP